MDASLELVRIVPNSMRGPGNRNDPRSDPKTGQCRSNESRSDGQLGRNLGAGALLQAESDVYRANYGEEHGGELFRLRPREKQIKRYSSCGKQRADRGGGRSRKRIYHMTKNLPGSFCKATPRKDFRATIAKNISYCEGRTQNRRCRAKTIAGPEGNGVRSGEQFDGTRP